MNDITASRDSWWLASLGNTLIWARLRVRPAGTAEVLDSDGNTLSYDSEDTARSQLFDAEFVEYDGLDEEDALVRGFSLHGAAAAGRQRRGPARPHDPVARRARLTPACSPRAPSPRPTCSGWTACWRATRSLPCSPPAAMACRS
jgi:hypothetical protein